LLIQQLFFEGFDLSLQVRVFLLEKIDPLPHVPALLSFRFSLRELKSLLSIANGPRGNVTREHWTIRPVRDRGQDFRFDSSAAGFNLG